MGTFNTLTLSDAGDADDRDNAGGMDDMPLIYAYTRADAIADGVLIDVSETAHQAGFVFPVALTLAVFRDVEDIPASLQGIADIDGRIWDLLWLASIAARRTPDQSRILYELHMDVGESTALYPVQLVCGPGDAGEPVITLMRPDES